MKALYFTHHGSLENLKYGDLDAPTPQRSEVQIQVKACALNHLDLFVLKGWPGLNLKLPHIGGSDIAGTISALGPEVAGWKIGDRVVVNPGYTTSSDEWTNRGEESISPSFRIFGESRPGGLAEFVTAPEANLLKIPDSLTFSAACAPMLVGLTGWRMLVKRAALRPGESVLVVGAGGGVNSFCIQLARHLGAEVFALTSSTEKMEKAFALGAKQVINYKLEPEWARAIKQCTNGRGVDVVIDNVGEQTIEQSIRALARGGRLVTVGNTSGPALKIDNRLLFSKQISILGSTMGSAEDFRSVMALIFSKSIVPVIDRELQLREGRLGYELLEKGEQFGKIVVLPS